jgi:UDP-N-acetylglucosamine--N-acetylmuramyl-(pentapeptide) pyrophosphoryl-undecaprenol N-acetylglucosamine transferase
MGARMNATPTRDTIVLAAGGTGGHLFPAQALANALGARGWAIVVMTDARFAHYATQFPGARIETVPSAPLSSLLAPFRIAAGILTAFCKLLALKPAAVVGFGGYPSVPVMMGALALSRPTAVIEQNTVMGRANRLVQDRVARVAAAFPIARFAPRDRAKIVLTGNPLRPEAEALWGAPYEPPTVSGPLRLLVFGGSQGARIFSELVPAALTRLPHDLKLRLQVVQQCRPEDLEAVKAVYANAEIRAELRPFFTDMPRRLAEAHLVIARSGAGTVAELMAIGRPAILVPLPSAMDDHQTDNAALLSRAGAGWLLAQKTLDAESLARTLQALLHDPSELAAKAEAAHKLAIPHAADNLADMAEQLARSSGKTRRAA